MSNGRRLNKGFWIQVGIIAFLVIAIVIVLTRHSLWEWLNTKSEFPDTHKYLLSATAQVLAALFALVFSITLIATQFVTKYTHRTMQIIFNRWVIGYMILFASSIIVPLAFLSNPSGLGSFISFAYGSAMVILLIAFFLDLKRRMNIGWIITCLKEEGLKAVANKNFDKARDNVEALDNISMGAYGDHNYDVFNLAVKALADYVLDLEWETEGARKSIDESEPPEEELHRLIFKALRDTFREVIDNPRAPYTVLVNIERIGDEAVLREQWRIINSIGSFLELAEEFSTKTATKPITDHRKTLSVACGRILHKYIVALPKPEYDLVFHHRLLFTGINMHKRHLSTEWVEYLVDEQADAVELACEVIRWKGIHHQVIDSITQYLFSYLDIYEETNEFDYAGYFSAEITRLSSAMFEVYNSKVMMFLVDRIKEYSSKYLAKEDPKWKEVGETLHLDYISMLHVPLEHKDYNLSQKIQEYLCMPILQGILDPDSVEKILYALIQTFYMYRNNILADSDEIMAVHTLDWLETAFIGTLRKGGWVRAEVYTDDLKRISREIVQLGVKGGWPSTGHKLFALISHTLDYKPKTSVDKYLLRYLWLAASIELLLDAEVIYGRYAIQMIYRKSLAEIFYQEYDNAVRLAHWVGLSKEIIEAKKTLEDFRQEFNLPRP